MIATTVSDTDTAIPRANGSQNGLMDATPYANSAMLVTMSMKTTSAKSYPKIVGKLTATEIATNAKTITSSIGTTTV